MAFSPKDRPASSVSPRAVTTETARLGVPIARSGKRVGAHRVIVMLAFIVAATSAPGASASDPFYDPLCVGEACAGAGTCVLDVGCAPRGCDVAVSCRGAVGPVGDECAVNETIDGRTCAVYAGVDMDAGGGTRVGFMIEASEGSVEAFNLFNSWAAPGAEADASILGTEVGRAFVYVYRSDISTEGPRGGPVGTIAPYENHTWTQIGVAGGLDGGPDVLVGIVLLDFAPEGCFVRSPSASAPGVECPPLGSLYPWNALP